MANLKKFLAGAALTGAGMLTSLSAAEKAGNADYATDMMEATPITMTIQDQNNICVDTQKAAAAYQAGETYEIDGIKFDFSKLKENQEDGNVNLASLNFSEKGRINIEIISPDFSKAKPGLSYADLQKIVKNLESNGVDKDEAWGKVYEYMLDGNGGKIMSKIVNGDDISQAEYQQNKDGMTTYVLSIPADTLLVKDGKMNFTGLVVAPVLYKKGENGQKIALTKTEAIAFGDHLLPAGLKKLYEQDVIPVGDIIDRGLKDSGYNALARGVVSGALGFVSLFSDPVKGEIDKGQEKGYFSKFTLIYANKGAKDIDAERIQLQAAVFASATSR